MSSRDAATNPDQSPGISGQSPPEEEEEEEVEVASPAAARKAAKERDASRKRRFDELTEKLSEAARCPVCFETIIPPIVQCRNGHALCEDCLVSVNRCPQCQVDVDDGQMSRNRLLESLLEDEPFACRFAPAGCPATVAYKDLRNHVKSCNWRPVMCQHGSCEWEGDLDELAAHMITGHRAREVRQETTGVRYFRFGGRELKRLNLVFTSPTLPCNVIVSCEAHGQHGMVWHACALSRDSSRVPPCFMQLEIRVGSSGWDTFVRKVHHRRGAHFGPHRCVTLTPDAVASLYALPREVLESAEYADAGSREAALNAEATLSYRVRILSGPLAHPFS